MLKIFVKGVVEDETWDKDSDSATPLYLRFSIPRLLKTFEEYDTFRNHENVKKNLGYEFPSLKSYCSFTITLP